RYLGEQFDIHCGGVDHINVHHTNEIAQSESATGKTWVNFWVHGEFLVMGQHKMAKSKGNFITLRTLQEEGYDPLDYRYFCLGGHYRSQLQFTFDSLDAARKARLNLIDKVRELRNSAEAVTALENIGQAADSYLQAFREHVSNDLHVPKALSVVWTLVKDEAAPPADKLAVLFDMDRVLGLKLSEVEAEQAIDAETEKLIREREEARANKDFARADQIRDELLEKGIELKDTPEGTVWKKKV
ncbi:MAG: CysS/YqeB C-terminal domain-containing protein, partial [Spirochaetota bacterium]